MKPKPPVKQVTKDARIEYRVPQITKEQLESLAADRHLSPSVYLQLLIDKEYNNKNSHRSRGYA